jgi:hypothetical protein
MRSGKDSQVLGSILVVAFSLGRFRRRHIISRSPLWTDVTGKPGCQLPNTSHVFGEGSLQVLKDVG